MAVKISQYTGDIQCANLNLLSVPEVTFNNDDLVNNVLTIPHGFDSRLPVSITIYDPSGVKMIAGTQVDATNIMVDFGDAIAGDGWKLVYF